MPQGNVGTPLSAFMELIRQCKLPAHVIKKLRLEFPKSRTCRRYGAVQMDYGTSAIGIACSGAEGISADVRHGDGGEGTVSKSIQLIENHDVVFVLQGGGDGSSDDDSGGGDGEEEEDGDDDGDDVEEWDKYEALHDDVDKQVTSLSFYWVLFHSTGCSLLHTLIHVTHCTLHSPLVCDTP